MYMLEMCAMHLDMSDRQKTAWKDKWALDTS